MDKQAVIIAREEAAAAKALEEAVPAVQAAEAAVQDIDANALVIIKNLPNPNSVIMDVCALTYFLYPTGTADGSWANVKIKLLGDTQLLATLKKFDPSKVKTDGAGRAKRKVAKLITDSGCQPGEQLNAFMT